MAQLGIQDLIKLKQEGRRFTVLTAYDAPMARILEQVGIPMLLVGDSLGNVVLGYRDTIPVTMDEMLHHCAAVRRGAPDTFVVGDMPFLSYQVCPTEAVRNAGLLVKQGGVDAVKLEGGSERVETIRRIVDAGIPVMGHLGLTPQSATLLGGMRAQATRARDASQLLREAEAVQAAGAFAIVLECIPREVAVQITRALDICTIGIGAGPDCDAQVLVTHDLLGLGGGVFRPRFVRRYVDLEEVMRDALIRFKSDVETGRYPNDQESFHMKSREREIFELEQTS